MGARAVGRIVVVAGVLLQISCGGGDSESPSPPPVSPAPAAISIVSGNDQSGVAGTTLSNPVRIRVTNAAGAPVNGVAVTWTVTAGGGSLAPATGTTGTDGTASSEWTLGSAVGPNSASAQVAGLAAIQLTATANPVPVDKVLVSSSASAVSVDESVQFVATLEDAAGNVLTGRTIAWSVDDDAKATINSSGLMVAHRAGAITVTASTDGVSGQASVSANWVPGLPYSYRSVKLWLSNNPPGQFAEYEGGLLDTTKFESWADVLAQIKAAGATDIVLQMSTGVMEIATDNDYSTTIDYNPADASLAQLSADAKALGLTVSISLFSHIDNVITGDGSVAMDRPQPSNPSLWMQNHRLKILERVRFAEQIGAYSVALFADEVHHLLYEQYGLVDEWVQLVRDVRQEFGGYITSIFWTPGYGNSISSLPASVIQELDYLGVGFFPNLVRAEEPDLATLCQGYFSDETGRNVIGFLRGLSEQFSKPIWITDKAFHSFTGASYDEARVFDSSIPLTPNQELQARLYDSFLSITATEGRGGWLQGVAFQNFNNLVDGEHPLIARFVEGPVSESPQHKLAEQVMSDWFNDLRISSCPD